MGYLAGLWGTSQQQIEQKKQRIVQEIEEIEQRLQAAKARLKALKSGEAKARDKSRRLSPGGDMVREAMQEIDSYIFTLGLELEHKRSALEKLKKPPAA
jgi:chromosome segregation ATPase